MAVMSSVLTDVVENIPEKDQIRRIEENYDHHFENMIPKSLHRGDIHSNKRLLGYIDAMMATCATFLILPLRNLHEMEKTETLQEFIRKIKLEFIIFFIGFAIVLTHWESINIRSFVIKRRDDFLVFLMILSLLAVSGLPFSLALQGHFSHEIVPVVVTCVLLALFEITEFVMIFYATATPRLLHITMHTWSKTERSKFRNIMVIKCLVNFIIVVIGAFLCVHHYLYSWVFMALLILTPLVRKAVNFLRRRFSKQTKMEKCKFFYLFTRGNISKDRVEAMSDAAMAIIACVLILDITVEKFPTYEQIKSHGLNSQLLNMKHEFSAFLLTYLIVSFLWYTNHSVLHLFRTINVVLLFFQKLFLASVCMLPLTSNMVTAFITANSFDTSYSIRLGGLAMLFSSASNLCMLLYGLYTKDKYLHKWATYGESVESNLRQHIYIILKSANMPFWSSICISGTLGTPKIATITLYASLIGMLSSFILLKVIFMNHVGKDTFHHNELELGKKSIRKDTCSSDVTINCDVNEVDCENKR